MYDIETTKTEIRAKRRGFKKEDDINKSQTDNTKK